VPVHPTDATPRSLSLSKGRNATSEANFRRFDKLSDRTRDRIGRRVGAARSPQQANRPAPSSLLLGHL
jgi:hypothetical protein